MAEIAHDYHNDLQIDETEEDPVAKNTAIEEVLHGISSHENDPEMRPLNKLLTEDDVLLALTQSSSGSAAGVNGIPNELWKKLRELHSEAKRTENSADNPASPTFDIVRVLTLVYNSIEKHGVIENTQFSTGWMCPIWKKKDPTDIANYWPITVLNTDYKLFTKALANKLSHIAPTLIHRDQAGFMKGRRILDQIYLAMEVVEYSEEELLNGAIIALDRKKCMIKPPTVTCGKP
jgi:hypothetical protein